MKYISVSEIAKIWGISVRRVNTLCNEGRIEGAQRAGTIWIIPDDAKKPADARVKSGKYIKKTNYEMSSAKMKKVKKCAALDKQHSDAEKRQRGRRREQDNKAGMRPRFEKL